MPIASKRDAIIAALREHRVVIVAGETGSGKSTQLPQYCLEIGRGTRGLIAHTQPRRVAARALAARIAEELSQTVGGTVGFRVRFADQVSGATRLVLMTDGLLLAELNSDPLLRRYDTVIVDEAHERTLNVDLLLGVLKRLAARRPDLAVIVTSATLDVDRVAHFFDGAPVITVGGRAHPVETRYREIAADSQDPDLPAAVLQACREIESEPGDIGRGDILVFLPGEREIRDVGEVLERELQSQAEVLPLYSRLAWEQQSRIFQRGTRRRVVLATNVAETSITVPDIRAVIDSGLARVSRYSARLRLQRLPIEPVSQAGAEQRKGRCGRLGPGLCVRLYSQADFEVRARFTEPEVLRTNLAALLLRLAADGLGGAEQFPFIDPPDSRSLNDGYRLLQELQALDAERCITRRGRSMARLPLDPRLARALLESRRFRAESEVLAIVAGLSVPDVRIVAAGAPQEDSADVSFEDPRSEFAALVKLWRAYRRMRAGPRRELRRWCRERRVSLLRLSEWQDVHAQLADRAADVGIVGQERPASYAAIHRALLAGFCTTVGTRMEPDSRGESGGYLGTRGLQFHLLPGSPLRRRRPRWVMAANVVETSRVFARCVAEVEPKWIEDAADHLVKREYLAPDWDEDREQVVAHERISMLGLTLSADRRVNFGPIAPVEARLIFAREALAYRRLRRRPDWLLANDAVIREAEHAEERLRTRDLLVGAESLAEFYAAALPRQVSSSATLEHFSRHLSDAQRRAITLTPADVYARLPDPSALAEFPERVQVGVLTFDVEYRFAPGEAGDGATLSVPPAALPLLDRTALAAAIPGLAGPRVEALMRSLPKEARRSLIPIGETAAAYLAAGGCADAGPLSAWIRSQRGVPAALIRFDPGAVPAHLTPQVAVTSGDRVLARGSDLPELRRACAAPTAAALNELARAAYPTEWRRFELEQLAQSEEFLLAHGRLRLYPALAAGDAGVRVRLHFSAAEAQRCMSGGAVALARLMLEPQVRDLRRRIRGESVLLLAASPFLSGEVLGDLLLHLVLRRACFADGPPIPTRAAFEAAVERARPLLHAGLDEWIGTVLAWFSSARAVRLLLEDPRTRAGAESGAESRAHLGRLLETAALEPAPPQWLARLPLYLKAEERRWQRQTTRGVEAGAVVRELKEWSARLLSLKARVEAEARWLPALDAFGWWIEEYRLSLYAQELKTLGPVSPARLAERAAEVEAWLDR